MTEFLIPVVLGILFGAALIHFYHAWQTWRALQELEGLPPEALKTLEKLENETLIILEVESVNNQFLCYNHFTKDFVCTGQNLVEIIKNFKQRYPDKDAAIARGDPAALAVLKKQFDQEINENRISI
jgi:hypothetical protein